MPARSQAQRGLIFSRRDQYGSKKNTPKKWKWIWDEDWENKGKLPKRKMKKKMKESLVHENLESFLNEAWDDKYNVSKETWISPEEARELFMGALEASDSPEELNVNIKEVFDQHPYMHKELGEIQGHDYYQEAIEEFIDAAREKFPGVYK